MLSFPTCKHASKYQMRHMIFIHLILRVMFIHMGCLFYHLLKDIPGLGEHFWNVKNMIYPIYESKIKHIEYITIFRQRYIFGRIQGSINNNTDRDTYAEVKNESFTAGDNTAIMLWITEHLRDFIDSKTINNRLMTIIKYKFV